MRLLLSLLVLVPVMTACADSEPDALGSACAQASPRPEGPVLLQEPEQDVPGPFSTARTDGPCGLLVTFTGSPAGDGPCNVAEYVGRVEPDGDDLRLMVEARRTGSQGPADCTSIGAAREARVTLDEPLGGRRLLDENGRLVTLVDGDRLLRPGALPGGWSATQEGQNVSGPVHWSHGLKGPSGASGELRQGAADLGRPPPGPSGFGYRELGRRTVRGASGLLVSFEAEQPGNHVLSWVEGDRGFALQVLGPLPDPEVLVEIANGLQG